MTVGGLIVAGLGHALIDASSFLNWMNMKEPQYVRMYGQTSLTSGQWLVAILGAVVDTAGILIAYIGIVASLGKVRSAKRRFPVQSARMTCAAEAPRPSPAGWRRPDVCTFCRPGQWR